MYIATLQRHGHTLTAECDTYGEAVDMGHIWINGHRRDLDNAKLMMDLERDGQADCGDFTVSVVEERE